MKIYIFLIREHYGRFTEKIKAHSVPEAVNKFKKKHSNLKKGWTLLGRIHPTEVVNNWRLNRRKLKDTLDLDKAEINSVWRSHEEVKGQY